MGYDVHVVVTPEDCAACHGEERSQFSKNIMAHARGNLVDNPLFMDLVRASAGTPGAADGG